MRKDERRRGLSPNLDRGGFQENMARRGLILRKQNTASLLVSKCKYDTYIYIHMYVCYMYMYITVYIYIYMYMYIYIHTYMYIIYIICNDIRTVHEGFSDCNLDSIVYEGRS